MSAREFLQTVIVKMFSRAWSWLYTFAFVFTTQSQQNSLFFFVFTQWREHYYQHHWSSVWEQDTSQSGRRVSIHEGQRCQWALQDDWTSAWGRKNGKLNCFSFALSRNLAVWLRLWNAPCLQSEHFRFSFLSKLFLLQVRNKAWIFYHFT